MESQAISISARFLALFVTTALALPPHALALRPQAGLESTAVRQELEGALAEDEPTGGADLLRQLLVRDRDGVVVEIHAARDVLQGILPTLPIGEAYDGDRTSVRNATIFLEDSLVYLVEQPFPTEDLESSDLRLTDAKERVMTAWSVVSALMSKARQDDPDLLSSLRQIVDEPALARMLVFLARGPSTSWEEALAALKKDSASIAQSQPVAAGGLEGALEAVVTKKTQVTQEMLDYASGIIPMELDVIRLPDETWIRLDGVTQIEFTTQRARPAKTVRAEVASRVDWRLAFSSVDNDIQVKDPITLTYENGAVVPPGAPDAPPGSAAGLEAAVPAVGAREPVRVAEVPSAVKAGKFLVLAGEGVRLLGVLAKIKTEDGQAIPIVALAADSDQKRALEAWARDLWLEVSVVDLSQAPYVSGDVDNAIQIIQRYYASEPGLSRPLIIRRADQLLEVAQFLEVPDPAGFAERMQEVLQGGGLEQYV